MDNAVFALQKSMGNEKKSMRNENKKNVYLLSKICEN